jgi:hypothetical protein
MAACTIVFRPQLCRWRRFTRLLSYARFYRLAGHGWVVQVADAPQGLIHIDGKAPFRSVASARPE